MPSLRAALIWTALAALILVPLAFAATSPLLQWRQPIYIASGIAGIVGLALLLLQPLLAAGLLPGVSVLHGRRIHRVTGILLVLAVVLHVAGLWITSPPDVIDALMFRSPTPFSAYGVVAMWAVFASALLAILRRRMRPRLWRLGHGTLAGLIVVGTILHALLIDGTMETVSKTILCAAIALATLKVLSTLKISPRSTHLRR